MDTMTDKRAGAGRAMEELAHRQAGRDETTIEDVTAIATDVGEAMTDDIAETQGTLADGSHEMAEETGGAMAESGQQAVEAGNDFGTKVADRMVEDGERAHPAEDDAQTAV